MTPILESRDSAAPTLTRAVASALQGRPFDPMELPVWERLAAGTLDWLWPGLLPSIVRWESKRRALPDSCAKDVDIEEMAARRLADYDAVDGRSESIFFGSALGSGAYLAAACQAPFVPEPFILGFRGGSPSDEIGPHLSHARMLAAPILANNPDVQLISHFDPVHDGWLTRHLNHVRIKPRWLLPAYQQFLRERLESGGTIVHLTCAAKWLSYQLEPRHRYQIGGWGGIGPHEFLQGSERIDRFLEANGSGHRGGWEIKGQQPDWAPESEWGGQGEFASELEIFADKNGYRYWPIRLSEPHHYSQLTLAAFRNWYQEHGVTPRGTFVGMFNVYAPHRVLERRLLPLWLVFNTTDSAEFLRQIKDQFADGSVGFAALVTFSETPDQVPWTGWERALAGVEWQMVGARPDRYPQDVVSLWRWPARLESVFPDVAADRLPRMGLSILQRSLEEIEGRGLISMPAL
ncbi:MAG: hypothetical protein WBR18_08615 [Anaerolineales bacterium]